jgi:hypothetical protein
VGATIPCPFLFVFCFWVRVSLCSSGWTWPSILLPQPPECWAHRHGPPHLAFTLSLNWKSSHSMWPPKIEVTAPQSHIPSYLWDFGSVEKFQVLLCGPVDLSSLTHHTTDLTREWEITERKWPNKGRHPRHPVLLCQVKHPSSAGHQWLTPVTPDTQEADMRTIV